MSEPIHSMDNTPAGSAFSALAELLRSRRQGQILAAVLADPEQEFPLSALARTLGIPYSSLHREVERAERFGIVTTRRFENLRLVRANVGHPQYPTVRRLLGS
jgi:DNA-binding MarR family transcriptional regulator